MARTSLLAALLLTLAAVTGCRSNDSSASHEFPCICGTPEEAINVCLYPLCASGEGNDENPDCACGTLTLPE